MSMIAYTEGDIFEGAAHINHSFGEDLRLVRPHAKEAWEKLRKFIINDCIPAEKQVLAELAATKDRWTFHSSVLEHLKNKAKALRLWNLFLPSVSGMTNLEYAYCAELMGRYIIVSEACNCSAPDTGNMEVLHMYGNEQQKQKWLKPLLNGDIRSVFFMTEPAVASSDARNIQCEVRREGDEYVINGRKWWSSGACDPRCKIGILMGKITNPEKETQEAHKQQSMILVPMDTPGLKILRPLTVFGYDDAPHGHAEVEFKNCRVKIKDAILLGEGRGFEIAQGRLGPGRIHHCMRSIGIAERALERVCARAKTRVAFNRPIATYNLPNIAQCRIQIESMRLLVLAAAAKIDRFGAKKARKEIAMIKVLIPKTTCDILDIAIQIHGGAGVSQDSFLAYAYALLRTLRLADGPDEVHLATIGKLELKDHETAKL